MAKTGALYALTLVVAVAGTWLITRDHYTRSASQVIQPGPSSAAATAVAPVPPSPAPASPTAEEGALQPTAAAPCPVPVPVNTQTSAVESAISSIAGAHSGVVSVTFSSEKISIQTAVQTICTQAGLQYDWNRSHANTNPQCRRYITVKLANVPLAQALDEIVTRNELRYRIEGKTLWLEK